MTKNDIFESSRLLYQGIGLTDTDKLVKWRSNFELINFFRIAEPITKEEHLRWYRNIYLLDLYRYDFIIIERKNLVRIGTVGAANINYTDNSFEISYLIGEAEFQRKGYASEAITAMISFMRDRGINTTFAEIHKDNEASIKTIQKLGFAELSRTDSFIKYVFPEGRLNRHK